jgi:hypothetical protein
VRYKVLFGSCPFTENQLLKMTNQKSVRYYSVAYLGSYATSATQDRPLGAPTESCRRLIEAAKRSKVNGNQKFGNWLSVSFNGLRLSVAGKVVEYPLSTVQGCHSFEPAPESLYWKEGAVYVADHYPAIFKLVTRPNDAEETLQCHLFICQQKRDADALDYSTEKQMKRRRQLLDDEPHVCSSLKSRAKRAVSLVTHCLMDRHFNFSAL